MTIRYCIRALAQADLESIWLYTYEQWGMIQADKYLEALIQRFEWLAELERINIDPDQWQQLMQPRGKLLSSAIGRIDSMRLYAQSIGQSWCQGMVPVKPCFQPGSPLYKQNSLDISAAEDIACLLLSDY